MTDDIENIREDLFGLDETPVPETPPPRRGKRLLSNAVWSTVSLLTAGLVSFITIGVVRRAESRRRRPGRHGC